MTYTLENVKSFLQNTSHEEISNITPVSGGEWSQAFFYEVDGNSKVIRFSQTDEDFLKDQYAHKFDSLELPIPEIEVVGKMPDGYYAISPKIEGEMIDHFSSVQMQNFVPHMFSLFNALRISDVSSSSGYGGWDNEGNAGYSSWKEFLSSVNIYDPKSRVDWREGLSSRPETSQLWNEVYKEMSSLLQYCPEDRHLIHNDLLHFNLLVAENKVAGVIDWGCSLYGDYLYDLAMFDLWQFYYPSMDGINWKEEAKKYFGQLGVDLTNFNKRLKCYECHLALDSIKYCAFKNNEKDLGLISSRIKDIIK